MTKTQKTKRALLASALSLIMCFTMLLGTTYAWFTDSVESGKNTIVAGNLDVELYYQNDETTDWTPVGDIIASTNDAVSMPEPCGDISSAIIRGRNV